MKLVKSILWIKGGSNEQTQAYGGRDHQQVARSRGVAGEGDVEEKK
jgi:hypothetical protein